MISCQRIDTTRPEPHKVSGGLFRLSRATVRSRIWFILPNFMIIWTIPTGQVPKAQHFICKSSSEAAHDSNVILFFVFFVSFFQLFSCHFLSHLCCSDASLGCVMYRVTSRWRLGCVTGAVRQNCPSNENERKERVIFCLQAKHLAVVEELNPITALTELRYCCINWHLNAAFTLWKTRGWLPSRSGASVSHGIKPRLDYATWWSAERSASAQTAGATTMDFFRFEVRKKKN